MGDPAGNTNSKKPPVYLNERETARAFTELAAFSDGLTNKLLGRIFTVVKRNISFKLFMAGANARLSGCDEKIFECYARLMRHYNEAIAIYEKNQWDMDGGGNERRPCMVSENVKNILHGVYTVLVSRACLVSLSENPIAAEKREIINDSVLSMMKRFDEVQKRFTGGEGQRLAAKYREANMARFGMDSGMAMMSGMTDRVLEACGMAFYDMARDAAARCLAGLNDIQNRRATTYYYDILAKELDILKTIVKVQFSAIESEMSLGQTLNEDKALIDAFLLKILEAYQFFSKGVEEITARFQEAERHNPEPPPEDFGDFMGYLAEQTDCGQIFPTYLFEECEKEATELRQAFEKAARRAVLARMRQKTSRLAMWRELYSLQKDVTECQLMSREMAEAFAGVTRWRESNGPPQPDSPHADIIAGVCETVDMKAESLAESALRFSEECHAVFEKAKNDAPPISDGEKKELRQTACDALFIGLLAAYDGEGKLGQASVRAALETCMSGPRLRNALDEPIRAHERHRDTILNKILNFKRDGLLYEMSTFEEVMNYSVSRLRESADAYVSGFVAAIDEASGALLGILGKNGITAIAPQPHEPFNGKEQEVLMAETNSEFQKGEIIKVMNRGYKQDETVLLRANVIAAK